jgi:hypothetical protein
VSIHAPHPLVTWPNSEYAKGQTEFAVSEIESPPLLLVRPPRLCIGSGWVLGLGPLAPSVLLLLLKPLLPERPSACVALLLVQPLSCCRRLLLLLLLNCC